jgi:hypothetical protein
MKKKMKTILENQIGCGEMSKPYTFLVTIMDTEEERKEPLSEQQLKDTLWASIEYRGTLTVLNIVRDY